MPLNTADSRTCDRPMKAYGPQNAKPRVKPGNSSSGSYRPRAGSTVPNVPVPDSSSHSRPSYQRGECGIDRPAAITALDGTSSSTPPLRLFSRQPPGESVAPSAVANCTRPSRTPNPFRWQRSSGV